MDVWKGEESDKAVAFNSVLWFVSSSWKFNCADFGSALKQLAGVERFRLLAGNRSCAKLYNLLFDWL